MCHNLNSSQNFCWPQKTSPPCGCMPFVISSGCFQIVCVMRLAALVFTTILHCLVRNVWDAESSANWSLSLRCEIHENAKWNLNRSLCRAKKLSEALKALKNKEIGSVFE